MNVVQADYGFEERTGAGYSEFVVTPPPLDMTTRVGVAALRGFSSFIVGLAATILFALTIGGSALFLLLFFVGTTLGLHLWSKRRSQAAAAQVLETKHIGVSSVGLTLDGVAYAREHITDVFVVTPKSSGAHVQTATTTVVVGSGVSGAIAGVAASANAAAGEAGTAAGRAFADHVIKRAYGVSMRYGAKDVPLVEAIEMGVAQALAEKLAAALATTR